MLVSFARSRTTRRSLLAAVLVALTALFTAGCPGSTSHAAGVSGTYEATSPEGTMTLEFKGDDKVFLTMQETGGEPDRTEAGYMVDGNTITIQAPGGFPMVLTRNGDVLQASMMGEILHFKKK
jgi:hypothetical protein